MRRELHVLVLNPGSSSLKFGLYRTSETETAPLLSGSVEAIGDERASVRA